MHTQSLFDNHITYACVFCGLFGMLSLCAKCHCCYYQMENNEIEYIQNKYQWHWLWRHPNNPRPKHFPTPTHTAYALYTMNSARVSVSQRRWKRNNATNLWQLIGYARPYNFTGQMKQWRKYERLYCSVNHISPFVCPHTACVLHLWDIAFRAKSDSIAVSFSFFASISSRYSVCGR